MNNYNNLEEIPMPPNPYGLTEENNIEHKNTEVLYFLEKEVDYDTYVYNMNLYFGKYMYVILKKSEMVSMFDIDHDDFYSIIHNIIDYYNTNKILLKPENNLNEFGLVGNVLSMFSKMYDIIPMSLDILKHVLQQIESHIELYLKLDIIDEKLFVKYEK